MRRLALALLLACAGCSDELPPLGEAILVVDTDVPVPELVGALRLDLYDYGQGEPRWYESRTIAVPDARDWPVSFSLYNPSVEAPRKVVVRLRAFPRRKIRDYRGERFAEPPSPDLPFDAIVEEPPPSLGEGPRLLENGVDRTPREEPLPALTIDRLFELDLEEGRRGYVEVVLRGDCLGTMADLQGRRSCIGNERLLEPLLRVTPQEERSDAPPRVGTFGAPGSCGPTREPSFGSDGLPLYDEEVCVPGGVFVFGNGEHFGVSSASAVPERVAVISPFRMDRFEVTVGRWRDALARGFVPPEAPLLNEGPIDIYGAEQQSCTYSTEPMGRETHPLSCVHLEAAQAFCAFHGGSLPTEAQWEHAAQAAGRTTETRYPWGDADPACERAIYGRTELFGLFGTDDCLALGAGPAPVTASLEPPAERDVSLGLGIVGLGGSMTEWIRDTFAALDAACWLRAPLHDPACLDAAGPNQSLRGGGWVDHVLLVFPGNRRFAVKLTSDLSGGATNIGFRCVRPAQ